VDANKKLKALGAYDDATIPSKYEENQWPLLIQCIPSPQDELSVAASGPPGTAKLPGNYPSAGFEGSRKGGCGTWSTAVCNRILGETDRNKPVDQVEWNEVARGIRQRPDSDSARAGQTAPFDIDRYYKDKGYCVETKLYGGSSDERKELGDKFVRDHCDVKLAFYRFNPGPPPSLTNGHVETVTGITARGIQTNSWGTDAYVQGGSNGGFSHSNPAFAGNWPPNQTRVYVSYVCKCGIFQGLF
jgi:hypothetical protein